MKLISLLFLIVPTIALSSTYNVQAPKLVGVDQKIGPVLTELLKSSLQNAGQIVADKETDYNLDSKLMKLESSYILSVRKSKSGKGTAKQIKTKSLDDLDKAVERVIKAVVMDKTVDQSITVKTVTDTDQGMLQKKIEPTRNWIFGIGPGWYRDMDTVQAKSIVLGYAWGLDYNFDLLAKYEFSYADDNNLDSRSDLALLGGSYYLMDSKHAPYVTADFGFGTFKTETKDVTGWGLGAGLGYKFFRTSTVNFSIEGKYTIFDSKIEGERPSLYSIKASIYF